MNKELLNSKYFEKMKAEELLKFTFEEFKDKVAIASSFGAEDVVLIDMATKIVQHSTSNVQQIRVFTLDTGRLPQETYKLMDEIREKYRINLEVYFPDTKEVEEMVRKHGFNLFYKSLELRHLCCGIRKVKPLNRALKDLSAWITGLRREQAVTRKEIKKVEIDRVHNSIIKINPIADWSEKDVWDYIKKNNVPYNELHDKGYPSIGCAPCTRAVKKTEDIRSGRWWWESPEKKECGLHIES